VLLVERFSKRRGRVYWRQSKKEEEKKNNEKVSFQEDFSEFSYSRQIREFVLGDRIKKSPPGLLGKEGSYQCS